MSFILKEYGLLCPKSIDGNPYWIDIAGILRNNELLHKRIEVYPIGLHVDHTNERYFSVYLEPKRLREDMITKSQGKYRNNSPCQSHLRSWCTSATHNDGTLRTSSLHVTSMDPEGIGQDKFMVNFVEFCPPDISKNLVFVLETEGMKMFYEMLKEDID